MFRCIRMSVIDNDWLPVLSGEFGKEYYKKLYSFVKSEYASHTVYPAGEDVLRAFNLTPLSAVKVVILGQDPYHEPGQAHGLSFSVKKGVPKPPSLENIYKELQDDLRCTIPQSGDLTHWAEQGVLLLNTLLTVRAHQAFSHKGKAGKSSRMLRSRRLRHLTGLLFLYCGVRLPGPRKPLLQIQIILL